MLFVSTVLIFYFNKKETEQALCYATMALALWRQGIVNSRILWACNSILSQHKKIQEKEIPPFKIVRVFKISNDMVFSHWQASFTFPRSS